MEVLLTLKYFIIINKVEMEICKFICMSCNMGGPKDKVHEGTKSALLQKLLKFGKIICVCLR